MKITVLSSKLVKPGCGSGAGAPPSTQQHESIPLTVFDKVTFDQRISAMNFFHPPAPSTAVLETGLANALATCRVWAGRLGVDSAGRRAIILNDAGARFVVATADVALNGMLPLEPTPETQSLHPSRHDVDELLLVQVTQFTCGSYVVGYTLHHLVADGHAMATTMVAFGQATRSAAVDPVPVIDRASVFPPRSPLRVEFEHRGAEFKLPQSENACSGGSVAGDEVVVHRVRFTRASISSLKSMAAPPTGVRPFSTVQCVVAHLWRCITAARRFGGREITVARVAVDGRARMRHPPQEYIGNIRKQLRFGLMLSSKA